MHVLAAYSASDKDGNQHIGVDDARQRTRLQIRRLVLARELLGRPPGGSATANPSFSPDGRWVIYNSDTGNCDNVYMADVQSI